MNRGDGDIDTVLATVNRRNNDAVATNQLQVGAPALSVLLFFVLVFILPVSVSPCSRLQTSFWVRFPSNPRDSSSNGHPDLLYNPGGVGDYFPLHS